MHGVQKFESWDPGWVVREEFFNVCFGKQAAHIPRIHRTSEALLMDKKWRPIKVSSTVLDCVGDPFHKQEAARIYTP